MKKIALENFEKEGGRRATSWSLPVVQAFNSLASSLRFDQHLQRGNGEPPANLLFVLDESKMDYTSDWCTACNLEATSHDRTKKLLFSRVKKKKEEKKNEFFHLFSAIPMCNDLPIGMRFMHDTYVFTYIICTLIVVLIQKVYAASETTTTQVIGVLCCSHKLILSNIFVLSFML